MKRRNIFVLFAAAVLSMGLSSCLKEQEDLFEESASARMQDKSVEVQKILESKSNGWVLYIYPKNPSTEAMNMGYIYTVKFSDNKVAARSERDGQGKTEVESYYKMTNDEGPVLSFDLNNSILHYWSTPGGSSSLYQGRGGDFEFNVMEAEDNYVKLVGKRYRAVAEMFPLEEDAESYITKCIANKQAGDDYFGVYAGNVKGDAEIYSPNGSYQIFWMGWEESDEETGEVTEKEFPTPFVVLPDRIRLYEPATIGGETFQEIVYDNNLDNIINYRSRTNDPFGEIKSHDFMADFSLNHSFGMTYIEGVLAGTKVFGMENEGSREVLKGIDNSYIQSYEWLVDQINDIPNLSLEELQGNYDIILSRFSQQAVSERFLDFLD